MIEVKDLVVGYGKIEILHGVSIRAKTGEITTIIGPNGSGKSTLLKSIMGLLKPWGGEIIFGGDNITGLKANNVLKKGISLVPQVRSVFPYLTVMQNLEMGGYILPPKTVDERVKEVFKIFPILDERKKQYAWTLSGGEQRILELGRALMLRPKVLILDEPSAMLSPKHGEIVFQEVRKLREIGLSVIFVEQNVKKALELADYVYVLDLGSNAFEGSAKSFLESEKLVKLYLGEV